MKKLFYILLISCSMLKAQVVISPYVFNAGGGSGIIPLPSGAAIEVFYNIGEPIITTVVGGSLTATQGFLQPEMITRLDYTLFISHESCLNKKDGKITILFKSFPFGTVKATVLWPPSAICVTSTCESVDSLAPGSYKVIVKTFNDPAALGTALTTDSVDVVINKSTEPCLINVYTGFTPNGDNLNDFWYIGNIEDYQDNKVTIFNRWGNEIAKYENYDNKDNNWKGNSPNGTQVPNGTYFYVIELNNGAGIKKGWVEVTGK